MKKPRVEDFDPNKPPQLGSSMDDLPAIERPHQAEAASAGYSSQLKPEQSFPPSPVTAARSPDRPIARSLARVAFEIYQDQHAALRQFWLKEQAQGGKESMSQMVREALDAYIAKRRDQEG